MHLSHLHIENLRSIGFGGGAALDVAKVVALMAVHDGDVIEYAWDHPQVQPIVNALPYLVALM